MSSSGLIYAVIVGAWAAYLVPMWLRRQDELNEARPTERFSTAIRLLSGRAGMERRYARGLGDAAGRRGADSEGPDGTAGNPDGVDVRALARPATAVQPAPGAEAAATRPRPRPDEAGRSRRAKLLARRRRTTMVLFLAFTLGAIVAAVGGVAFLWAPAVPAGLLSAYIAHLRTQERRRFAVTMDRRRAEDAARRLREQRRATAAAARSTRPDPAGAAAGPAAEAEADRQALVEQTDHAEWLDSQRSQRGRGAVEGWDPVPVPLPTYVNAPVARRTTRGLDLDAEDAWSSGRSAAAPAGPGPSAAGSASGGPSRRTPLFDQYADGERPRAANE